MEEQNEVFTCKEFSSRLQRGIKNLRDDRHLCDFTITVQETQFSAHKLMLAACSDYFKAMFVHDSLEHKQNRVQLHDVSPAAMEAILEFCYTSQISLTIDNVQEILVASSLLQISDVQDMCVGYIKNRIDISNCLGIFVVADRCNLRDLFASALNFCLDKFGEIVEEREFLQLDYFWLAKLISHSQLNVDNEDKVFKAVINWFEADKDSRLSKLDQLMSHVRFSLIDPVELIRLSSNEYIRQSAKCCDLINEAKDFLLLSDYPEQRSQMIGVRFQPRVPLRRQQRIYAVGGWTNEYRPIASVEKYNPYSDDWVEVNPMTRPRCGVGVTILGNSIYAVGGHDGQSYLKSAERYDILDGNWHTDVADMKSERTSVGVVSLGGYVYAIGGQGSQSTSTANVERYDPKNNTWEECAPLVERRLGAGVTVLNGKIYVMGGADQRSLNTVECFDPITNKWTYVTPMLTSRKHLGCTAYQGKLYAVGGRGDSSEMNDAECYDPERDCWEFIPSMSEKRSGIGLVELDGLLYAVGGHNGDLRLKLVEAYDPIRRAWTTKKPMIYERLGGGLASYSSMNCDTPVEPTNHNSSTITRIEQIKLK